MAKKVYDNGFEIIKSWGSLRTFINHKTTYWNHIRVNMFEGIYKNEMSVIASDALMQSRNFTSDIWKSFSKYRKQTPALITLRLGTKISWDDIDLYDKSTWDNVTVSEVRDPRTAIYPESYFLIHKKYKKG